MHLTKRRHIQLYEHDTIRVGDVRNEHVFTETDWNHLLQLNENQYPPYLQPIHRGIRTLNYVGLIQLPDLCLEILPKTDRHEASQHRHLLLELLYRSKKIPAIRQLNCLGLHEGSLTDHFLFQFLEETEKLCSKGLVKKYSRETSNFSRYRGRMVVREQIRHNHSHKERVFAEYQAYDKNHLLHHLLRQALCEVPQLSNHREVIHRSRQLLDNFQDSNIRYTRKRKIRLTRQDQHYTQAIGWASLILDKMVPGTIPGTLNCSAFLFDMQQLFEEVVTQEISAAAQKKGHQLMIQPRRDFWRKRKIQPDMHLETSDGESIILDTKWKILDNQQPNEADLKQMYIYNRFFQAKRGVLIYPGTSGLGHFKETYTPHDKDTLSCEVVFANLWNREKNTFNTKLGEEMISQILKRAT